MYGIPDSVKPLSAAEEQVMLAVWACRAPVTRRDIDEKLRAKGAKVVEMDLTRTDVSYAVTEAFRCGKIVLACATYDGFLFPPMENLLTHLKTKNFQNRTVGLMENGTWAPMAAKLMRAELESMKNITLCENVVTIRSAANAAAEAQMDALAAELVAK